jgi:hypothetical protein
VVCLVHPASGLITTAANADAPGRVEDAIDWLSPFEQFPDDPPSEDCLLDATLSEHVGLSCVASPWEQERINHHHSYGPAEGASPLDRRGKFGTIHARPPTGLGKP